MTEYLNAALAAIALSGKMDEGGQPPSFWQERATTQAAHALELHTAWASLIRYKSGEALLPQNQRQFKALDMLLWLTTELQLLRTPPLDTNLVLLGNRETLQEALLLLHSCAYTLGPGVNLVAQSKDGGVWFRILYDKVPDAANTLETLVTSAGKSWRVNSAAFELRRARDFLRMNNCDLVYRAWERHCELSFFVPAILMAGQSTRESAPTPEETLELPDVPPAASTEIIMTTPLFTDSDSAQPSTNNMGIVNTPLLDAASLNLEAASLNSSSLDALSATKPPMPVNGSLTTSFPPASSDKGPKS
ncbi:MAG: hypothetical protein H7175_24745 [Burkholderiales bacterium]|nr:hypothetical protein [Anaerolineae bacterium]